MDGQRRLRVPEVEKGEIDEVEDEHCLGEDEMRVHPEEHEAELQEVVDDEVGADVCGEGLVGGGGGEEGGEVVDLQDDEDDPVGVAYLSASLLGMSLGREGGRRGSGGVVPVEIDDEGLQGEGRGVCFVLAPDGAVGGVAGGGVEAEVDVGDVCEEEGGDGEDLVG